MPSNHLILCHPLLLLPSIVPSIRVTVCVLSHFCCVRLFATPWTRSRQAPPSMGFSRQEYWSGLPFPAPGDLPNPGMAAVSPVSPALAAGSLPLSQLGILLSEDRWPVISRSVFNSNFHDFTRTNLKTGSAKAGAGFLGRVSLHTNKMPNHQPRLW